MPAVSTYATTGNPYIDGVLGDYKWATATLAFSFPTSASFYGGSYGDGETGGNFAAFSAGQQNAVRSVLHAYASVINLSFLEKVETATNHADLRYAQSDRPGTAWAYMPSPAAEGGDAWFNRSAGYYNNLVKGNYAFTTILHETGHALGLEHAHEHYVMPVERDSMEYTVMSYRSYVGSSATAGYTNEHGGFAQSLMMYDIAAVQHMYGADFRTQAGATTYSWSATTGEAFINRAGQGAPVANRIFETVWDGGGIDTYDFSNFSTSLRVDLRPGEWTTTSSAQLARLHWDGSKLAAGNIANALLHQGDTRSLIENAAGGSGADAITGNQAWNTLWGKAGNDRLYGLTGNDILIGGAGSDLLDGGAGADRASYKDAFAGVVADLKSPSVNTGDAKGDRYINIEGLIGSVHADSLRGSDSGDNLLGGNGADKLFGRGGNDKLLGDAGNDLLYGEAGADAMYGGEGADLFVFSATGHSPGFARDMIGDFTAGVDRINLATIDASSKSSGNQAFLYIGGGDFTGRAGQLNFKNGVVSGDINGDRVADFQIDVLNVMALGAGDFYL